MVVKQNKPYSNSAIAVLSNEVCKGSYNLSVSEHRLIKMFLCQIKDYYQKELESSYLISTREYADAWKLELHNARREIDEATSKLLDRKLYIVDAEGNYIKAVWVSDVEYRAKADTVELWWSNNIRKHISQLKERFTKLDLLEIQDFSSSYSFRLYEILTCSIGENSYKNPKYAVEDLMRMLQVPPSLTDYRNFKARVLNPCSKELSEKTGKFKKLTFVEHKVKGSKKVESIEFQGCGIGNKYK